MATAKPKTQAYTVLEPILHDGTKHMPGQPIELTEEQAKSMTTRKLVTLVPADAEPGKGAE